MTSVALLTLGSIVAVYWYRVLQMAADARRRTGRAANLLPPEPLGRALRALWVPAIVVWIAHPIASAFLKKPSFSMRPVWQPSPAIRACIAWVAVLVVLAAFAATMLCWKRMGRSWRMGIDPAEKTPLVATGPFAYVRHPIYSLSAMMMLAAAVALPTPLMLTAAVIHITLLFWESTREEHHLLRTHGAEYQHYRTRVGRFIPVSSKRYKGKDEARTARGG
jgi:protein-S-isoprenylcysteine O-methyltransferase Ste14